MNVHHLTDPREEEILILCHQLAEVSLRPLPAARGELLRLTARVQRLLSGGPC